MLTWGVRMTPGISRRLTRDLAPPAITPVTFEAHMLQFRCGILAVVIMVASGS